MKRTDWPRKKLDCLSAVRPGEIVNQRWIVICSSVPTVLPPGVHDWYAVAGGRDYGRVPEIIAPEQLLPAGKYMWY